jgi:hypothetical protein
MKVKERLDFACSLNFFARFVFKIRIDKKIGFQTGVKKFGLKLLVDNLAGFGGWADG